MGCSQSGQVNSTINNKMQNASNLEKQVKKLLLLGSGSSGKSTLFKQIKRIHGEPVQENERQESKHVIRMNLVQGMLVLLQQAHKLFDQDQENNKDCQINMEDLDILNAIQQLVEFNGVTFQEPEQSNDPKFNEQINEALSQLGENLALLWSTEGVQATFGRRQGLFSFPDNLDFFFDKVTEVMEPDYRPNEEDVLKVRIRTTGMITYEYDVDSGPTIHIIDVGGQRNERKKWIHHFTSVTAVIFVAALNHYAAVLFEDENRNAMHEAVQLFHEIRNSKWFKNNPIILFLNKKDLFEENIRLGKSLSECFSEEKHWGENMDNMNQDGIEDKSSYQEDRFPIWDGPDFIYDENCTEEENFAAFSHCVEVGERFIGSVFKAQTMNTTLGSTHVHVITATDQDATKVVFEQVQHQVILGNLYAGGLVGNMGGGM